MGAARYHLQDRVCCRSGIDTPTCECSLSPSHCLQKAGEEHLSGYRSTYRQGPPDKKSFVLFFFFIWLVFNFWSPSLFAFVC